MNIEKIIPYARNARHNEKAIPEVAESIKSFGFQGQILLESKDNPVIVCGHTRVAACKLLGWTEIPDEHIAFCDGLSEDEIKAFRLVDNKTSEAATWNKTLLQHEIRDIESLGAKKLDMSRFRFDFESKQESFRYGQERLKTDGAYNLPEMYASGTHEDAAGEWGIPKLEPVDFVPDDLVGFNYVKSYKGDRSKVGVHFFVDDYQFERVWTNPAKWSDVFRQHQCVVMPDFSLYADMPLALQVYNAYRNAFCARVWQKAGAVVVPCLLWSTPESWRFCFDAIPEGSTVCVSTVGVMADKEALAAWKDGMSAAIARTSPARILLYGSKPDFDFGDIEIVHYKARRFEKGN